MKSISILALAGVLAIASIVWPAAADWRSIREGIESAVEHRPGFGPHQFEIEYYRGTVTLSGYVSSEADRKFVETVASDQYGVANVVNKLQIRDAQSLPSNYELARRVKDALVAIPGIHGYSVQITARGSLVELTGEAETQEKKRQIEEAAARVNGVSSVDNKIMVAASPPDSELVERVRRALAANPEVNLNTVEIAAREGVVTFKGEIANHREGDRILSTAVMVPGVKDIRSEFKLK